MGTAYAIADGNWSNAANWNGGTLPGTTDDVYANNHTVTIDQNITVNSLRNIANTSPAITDGGHFVVSSGAITATVTDMDGSTSISATANRPLVEISHTSGTVTFNNTQYVYGCQTAASAPYFKTVSPGNASATFILNTWVGGNGTGASPTVIIDSATAVQITEPTAGYGALGDSGRSGHGCPVLVTSTTNPTITITGSVKPVGSGSSSLSDLAACIITTTTAVANIIINGDITGETGYASAKRWIAGVLDLSTTNGNVQIRTNGKIAPGDSIGAYGIAFSAATILFNGQIVWGPGSCNPPLVGLLEGHGKITVLSSASSASVKVKDSAGGADVVLSTSSGGITRPATGKQWPLP